ncbi:IS3 family transposase [Vibrio barjaei]|uniref:IS3 family transposase n=1 Tax=Vibrio barjaei TaxID=1676683 RepID=UPI003990B6C5
MRHCGYRNIHKDLLETRTTSGRDRVLRLMRHASLKAQCRYETTKDCYGGKSDSIIANTLNR